MSSLLQRIYRPFKPRDVRKPIKFACARAPFRWAMSQENWLMDFYPDMENHDVCDTLNISGNELQRKVHEMRLRKSRDFNRWAKDHRVSLDIKKSIAAIEEAIEGHVSPAERMEQFNNDREAMVAFYRRQHFTLGLERCKNIALSYRPFCGHEEIERLTAVMYEAWKKFNPFDEKAVIENFKFVAT